MSVDPAVPALFDAERQPSVALSRRYSVDPEYRASVDRRPSWTKIANPAARGAMCDECAHLQHETGEKFGPRMQPRQRRHFLAKTVDGKKIGGGPALRLCSRHEQAWRERDDIDRSERRQTTESDSLRRASASALTGYVGTGNALGDAVTRRAERGGMDR